MKSLRKPGQAFAVALGVLSLLGVVSATTGCGQSQAQPNASAMQDSMKSDGMMKDAMSDGMMSDGMMKDGMMKDGMMKDAAAPVGAEMKSEKKM